jgi:hypothetical protein
VSGTKDLDCRPGLAALLDRIESNGVKVVMWNARITSRETSWSPR